MSVNNPLVSQAKATVYIFLSVDCPICQAYSLAFQDWAISYPDINFVGVFPNFSSKPEAISLFVEKYSFPFTTRTDYAKDLCKKFDVKVTPEVVVVSSQNNQVLYKGRIDNEFVALGKRRRIVTINNLEDVLSNIREGNYGPFPFTEAIGCLVEKYNPYHVKK